MCTPRVFQKGSGGQRPPRSPPHSYVQMRGLQVASLREVAKIVDIENNGSALLVKGYAMDKLTSVIEFGPKYQEHNDAVRERGDAPKQII